jgi:hypothetical protein
MNNAYEKFTIGQLVATKKTGLPGVGEISGIMTPIIFQSIARISVEQMCEQYTTWNKHYPDWHTKPVVIVHYKEPRKTMSKEEADFFNLPYEEIPVSSNVSYCIDDLEILE